MTNSKKTKRTLLASVLSMMLCMTMLVGSTFAWFTDSVTSGKNRIVAGNLDVELEYAKADKDGVLGEWTKVEETTNIFDEAAFWEPGYTEVVYLRVKNVGSLALKYKLGINVVDKEFGYTENGAEIDLANFIKFGVVANDGSDVSTYSDRAEAVADAEPNATLLSTAYTSEEGHLEANTDSNTMALVVYMPTTVGNEANHGTDKAQPSITLGLNLVATQDTVESDSFDEKYDENALYADTWDGTSSDTNWYSAQETAFSIDTANELAGLAQLVNEGTDFSDKIITLSANINLNGEEWTPIGGTDDNAFNGIFDGNNKVISNLAITAGDGDDAFFGAIQDATVQNLELRNVNVQSPGRSAAAVMWAYGNSTISGVTVSGNVEGTITSGIVSYAYNEGYEVDNCPTVTITDCVNNATVTGSGSKATGIIAQTQFAKPVITGCVNNGTIICDNEDGEAHAAGIVGYIMRQTGAQITDCTNNGDITGISGAAQTSCNVGGIVANVHQGACTLRNVTNNGNISSTGAATDNHITSAGGIVGRVSSGNFVLEASSASGNIYATSPVTTNVYAGGAIGYFAANNVSCQLTNVTISGTVNATAENAFKGSVFGYFGNNITGELKNIDLDGVTSEGLEIAGDCYYRNNNLKATLTLDGETIF